jgi:ankyrin repeat protein
VRRRIALCGFVPFLPLAVSGQLRIAGEAAEDYWNEAANAQLARAAAEGRVEDIQRLVKGGARVNAVGKQNMTPLVWALTARNPSGMRALLELGADPNQRVGPEKEFHPVWLAAGQDQPDQLRVLLEFNGDPNASHKGADYVPLMRALMNAGPSRLVNVQLLVRAGANINASNSLGSPFVLAAASLAQYDIVLFALQNGYNNNLPLLAWEINDRRPDGKAPLPPELEPKRRQVMEALTKMGVSAPPGPAPRPLPRP